ncbi:MAG: serine/threonine protein kinase [Anaerolineaceae bacterium]|nr:serine/threonine protein kinase [Anaerolineaceae bacterium]
MTNTISKESIKRISSLFCGDAGDYYAYKSGPRLVSFFNQYFDSADVYKQGFPSRWAYVYDKIVEFVDANKIDSFFNIILSKEYLIRERGINEVAAAELSARILDGFNSILQQDGYKITHANGRFHFIREDDDLILIGSGGFANVYRQKSTGLVIKKLKDDFLTDIGVRSRFKREFEITKSLQGVYGIITVYSFDEGNCSYTMELAETTLAQYVLDNQLNDQEKLKCIRQILRILSEVHKRNIIHRDISPNNIFIISGQLKIADFGLGKDLKVFTSHQTMYTNALGQYYYCAPEQFMMLKDADKRSDVYSLGRIINFIMTKDPTDSHHIYRSVTEKATCSDAAYRYGDAIQLATFFEKAVSFQAQADRKESIKRKIQQGDFDADVESYIFDLGAEEISKLLLAKQPGFANALIRFMKTSDEQAQHVIQSIDQSFRDVCGRSFEAYDPFATFATSVLRGQFTYIVKEIAANILRYVAWDVNRFSAQHLVENLISQGMDPTLEDIIRN